MYYKKLTGEKCYLSPIDVEDAPIFTEWLNDMELTRYLTLATYNITIGGEREALVRLSKEHNYSIIALDTEKLIGNCGLMDLDQINRSAELGIFIGNKEYLSKGYGTEALRLLIDYAFNYLDLENILLKVYSFNERAIRCYEKVGFRKIGIRRNAIRRERKNYDIVLMDIVPSDFYA